MRIDEIKKRQKRGPGGGFDSILVREKNTKKYRVINQTGGGDPNSIWIIASNRQGRWLSCNPRIIKSIYLGSKKNPPRNIEELEKYEFVEL